jgi:hypothetical protein
VLSQNHATATLSTEEPFVRLGIYCSSLISASEMLRGQEIDCQRETYRQSELDFSSQPDLHSTKQGLQSQQLFCDWGRQIKADFCI